MKGSFRTVDYLPANVLTSRRIFFKKFSNPVDFCPLKFRISERYFSNSKTTSGPDVFYKPKSKQEDSL